jgi:hypothetical protein
MTPAKTSRRREVPPPPAWLGNPDARAAWQAVAPTLAARGRLLPIPLAVACARYGLHVWAIRALETCPPRSRAGLRMVSAYGRHAARKWAAEARLLPPERLHVARLGHNGVDLDLREIFRAGDCR